MRINDWLAARRERRKIERLAAASDDELRDEYARLWRADYHLEAARQAVFDAREHVGHVPYSGPSESHFRRVDRVLYDEQSTRNAIQVHLESEMYRRWGRPTGQPFGEWIRPFRDEVRDEAREAAQYESRSMWRDDND